MKWCNGCGQVEHIGFPLPYRVHIKAHKGPKGWRPVPGYYVYACSLACRAKTISEVAQDEVDLAAYLLKEVKP